MLPDSPGFVSIAYGAVFAGVSQKTLRRMISAGKLRAYRLGPRLIRVSISDLESMFRPIPTVRKAG